MNKFKVAEVISTFFYSGKSRFCPGTMGSIATLPLWFLIISFIVYYKLKPLLTLILFTTLVGIVGYWATKIYIAETHRDDPKEIVIDEVVGQLLSFIFSFSFIFFVGNYDILQIHNTSPYFLHTFLFLMPIVFFRIYDITKPLIIGTVDRKMKNALGVMLDDVIAGIFAGITNSIVIFTLLKLFFM
ncbi:MAG: phosphatidylglycerophosphatase A [Rickettsiales bacterium]|jgi:phosphatidylglycerophosphatase A|nr:phosphatidylglycerophosphatase A [Rickettsiales bacterium]